MRVDWTAIRSALFVPATNARAIEKARTLAADLIVLDLEDSVKPTEKAAARDAARAALAQGFGETLSAVRINANGTPWYAHDLEMAAASRAAAIVLPKVEQARDVRVGNKLGIAMIETPAGLIAANMIAALPQVAALMAGVNDLSAALRVPGRAGLTLALQTIVLAARAHGRAAYDGVYNRLDQPTGFAAECAEGRAFGFDGKSLIHPSQIEPANRAFGPSEAEIEEAEALVAAATGGAERFRDRMIEAMHVEAARRVLKRAGRG